MSNYEQKEGQGSLFKNDKKTNEKQPDYRGSLKWRNQTLTVAGWIKESKTGTKFLSLKVESQDSPLKIQSNEQNSDDFSL